MLLYIYNKDASFLFKERFFETTLNDEFQKFWEKKKRKIPLSAIWLVQRDFSFIIQVYYIKSEIYFSFFTAFMIISK